MFDPMDIDDKRDENQIDPEVKRFGKFALELVHTAVEDTITTLGSNASSEPPARIRLEYPRTKKDIEDKISSIVSKFEQLTLVHRQKKRVQKHKRHRKDLEKSPLRKEAHVTWLSYKIVEDNLLNSFVENCEKTLADWVLLLSETTLPSSMASSDPRIITAFKAVDNVICGNHGTYLLQRLAHVQLMRLFTLLEGIIESERQNGPTARERYYGDASFALDIYMAAQESCPGPETLRIDTLRRQLAERKRAGRRWRDLARPCPLFVLIYSKAAEPVVKDFKRIDMATIKLVATQIFKQCADQLVRICAQLSEETESAVKFNRPFDTTQIVAQIRQSLRII